MWPALIAGGVGLAGSLLSSRRKGTGGMTGAQVVTMPTYAYDEPMRTLQSEAYTNQLRQQQDFFERGQLPPWLQQTSDYVQRSMKRPLQESFYGSPMGGPGIMDSVRSAGAAAGVGAAPMMRQTMKAGQEYARRSQAIDEMIAKLGADSMTNMYQSTGSLMNAMPQGPQSVVVPGQNIPEAPDYWGQAMQGIAGTIPYLFGNGQKMPWQTSAQTTQVPGAAGQYDNWDDINMSNYDQSPQPIQWAPTYSNSVTPQWMSAQQGYDLGRKNRLQNTFGGGPGGEIRRGQYNSPWFR